MSRGDDAKLPVGSRAARLRGLPVAAAFAVFVLVAACATLWATHGVERLFENGLFGGWGVPQEPFSGARSAVASVGWHGCLAAESGPTVGAPRLIDEPRVDAALALRGYVPEGEWSDPRALPFDDTVPGLEGGCGLVALVAPSGSNLSRGSSGAGAGAVQTVCAPELLLLGICGGAPVHVEGTGTATMRVFAAPGLTPDILRATGLPTDVALAHAEAASALAVAGWTASDEVVGVRVPAAAGTYGLTVRPPSPPAVGCLAYVAVGVGLGHARIYWPGGPLPEEATVDRFESVTVACGGAPYFDGTLNLEDADHDGGRVWFRAYSPPVGGPAMPALGARRPLAFTMHVVRASDAVMPAPFPAPAAP